jgi:hypothetical protein
MNADVRHKHVDAARDALLKGAASLTELRNDETIAFAILQTTIALMELAKSDTGERAKKIVEEWLKTPEKP